MAEGVTIRPFRHGDGAGCAGCWIADGQDYGEMAPEVFRAPDTDGLAEWMDRETLRSSDGEKSLCLVAQSDGQVVGFVEGSIVPPLENHRYQIVSEVGETRLSVNALSVHPAHRRRGIGKALLDAIETWGRERGATLVVLDTWIDSPVSVPFYDAIGYDRRQIGYRKRL